MPPTSLSLGTPRGGRPLTDRQSRIRGGELDIEHVSISLGQGPQRFEVLHDVSLRVVPGEFICLLGPSGCGKSTLLGAIAGHLPVASGRLMLDGEAIAGPHPQRGLVFQQHTLFPWLRVIDNVAYGLKMQGVPAAERRQRAHAVLQSMGLEGFGQRYPRELSGGMQQRVEIARVLINEPRVLLMDEPFGALDALTRLKMQELLLGLWEARRATVLFVTHDIDEALFLADRILVLSPRPGRLIEELHITQPRPRGAEWLTDARFTQLKRHCLGLLRHPGEQGTAPLPRLSPLGPSLADARSTAPLP